MIDMKKWLRENASLRNYDDPDIDPDKVIGRHRKVLASAKSALRDHLQQQLHAALQDFYSDEVPEEKKLFS